MAQICGFFDAKLVEGEYDRVYVADQFAGYFRSFIGNGIFNNYGADILNVVENTPKSMSVVVTPGQGWINGYWYKNTENVELNLDLPDGTRNRIDSIVLRWDKVQRDMYVAVIKGEFAINPVAPTPVRDDEHYDLLLATVYVKAGALNISQKDITDTRMNTEVCGWVTGVVDQVDTSTLYQQFQDYFENFVTVIAQDFLEWSEEQKEQFIEWSTEQKNAFELFFQGSEEEFNNWFNTIRGILDEEAAGRIINLIDGLRATISDTYNSGTLYKTGDYVYHNNVLYKCLKNNIGGWNEEDWKSTTITDELKSSGLAAKLDITVPEGCKTTIYNENTGDEFVYQDETYISRMIYDYGIWNIKIEKDGKVRIKSVYVQEVKIYNITMSFYDAKIRVNYPEGSICTCEKDLIVLEAIGTSGEFNFDLPEGGEWEVKITDGVKSASKIINITEEIQYEISISYYDGKIDVTYPEGATCTCEKESTILEAPDTFGHYLFDLPEGGEWTVRISKEGEDDGIEVVNVIDEITYTVDIDFYKIVTWADGTDEEIVKMVKAAERGQISLQDYWNVGDERKMNLPSMNSVGGLPSLYSPQEVTWVLLNKGGKILSNGNECEFVVGTKECLYPEDNFNDNGMNNGWKNSLARTWLNSVFKNAVPTSIASIFKEHKSIVSKGNISKLRQENGLEIVNDYFSFPTFSEVVDSYNICANDEAYAFQKRQFEYYKQNANRKKKSNGVDVTWWTNSPSKELVTSEQGCIIISIGGGGATLLSEGRCGISPHGVIGSKPFTGATLKVTHNGACTVSDGITTLYSSTSPETFNIPTGGLWEITVTNSNGTEKQYATILNSGEVIEKTLNVVKIVSFTNGTDDEIADMLDAYYNGILSLDDMGWRVGDTRTLRVNTVELVGSGNPVAAADYTIGIVATEHHTISQKSPGTGIRDKACISIMFFVPFSKSSIRISVSAAAKQPWENTDAYRYNLPRILEGFNISEKLKSRIIYARHSRHQAGDTTVTAMYTEKLFLPTLPEVTQTYSRYYTETVPREGEIMEAFKGSTWLFNSDTMWTSSMSNSIPTSATNYMYLARPNDIYMGAAHGTGTAKFYPIFCM